MRKILAIIALTVATIAGLSVAPADAATRHRVPRTVCAKAWEHPASHTAERCRRQGWTIDVDYDSFDGIWDVVVIGPRGRVYVDTFGQYGNVR